MKTSNRFSRYAEMDDHDLIRAFLNGETNSFDVLVNRHKNRLFNLCFWFLGDYQEADDICQDVFIKIFKSLKTFRFEASFTTWSYRIAVNTCKNRTKSVGYRVKKWTAHIDAAEELPAAAIANGSENGNPQQALEKKERMEAIWQALNALAPDKRAVAVLRDIEGLSYEDISIVMGLPVGTVKSRLVRARNDLKNMLAGL